MEIITPLNTGCASQIAEWVRLTEERQKMAQLAPLKDNARVGAGRGNQGGIRAASRELGIDRDKVRPLEVAA